MSERAENVYERSTGSALKQGEILSDLIEHRPQISQPDKDSRPTAKVYAVHHPYAIVITQACDLDLDFKARQGLAAPDKTISSILLCEAETAEELRGRGDIKSDIWKRIRQNQEGRYHFLQSVLATEDFLEQGLPELGVDFKRYFAVLTEEVYRQIDIRLKRRCHLKSPYLEHFSTRFWQYQGRIALPEDHFSSP